LGVRLMTFDSIEELERMTVHAPLGKFVLRLKVDDSHAAIPLSAKFGATKKESEEILEWAFRREKKIVGISFHVGSNCKESESYENALLDTLLMLEIAKNRYNMNIEWVDLGGGWPSGVDNAKFKEIGERVNVIFAKFSKTVSFIAEPGRYFVASAVKSATRIIGKKVIEVSPTEKNIVYYLAQGSYGIYFNSIYFGHDTSALEDEGWNFEGISCSQVTNGVIERKLYPSVLWGPTCDSGDRVGSMVMLPEMNTDDFIFSENFGAYTTCMVTDFNMMDHSKAIYVACLKTIEEIC